VLLVTALVAIVLAWLNRSPWWGWLVVGALLGALALGGYWMRHRPVFQRVAVWVVGATGIWGAAVMLYPAPDTRVAGGSHPLPTDVINTTEGPVQGVTNDAQTVEIFAGIPFAQPPVADLRWRAPQPPEQRDEVLRADRFSAAPIQPTSTFATRALSRVVKVPLEGTLLNPYMASEDSLTLNIWRSTTRNTAALPVLVYIPGGGFATGSGALPLYDGEALAARGAVITVTINYRLGVFGFLSHRALAEESGSDSSGNYGILDQVAALEWVRANIASFGGDPERVTIAGESAGGESVCILGVTPLAEGLFHGIIGASGACMGTTGDTEAGDQYDTRETAEAVGMRLSERLDGATIEEMRSMSVDQILRASGEFASHWRPPIDGHVLSRLPSDIYAVGDQHDVPLLVGSNADESSLALAAPPRSEVEEYEASAREKYGADADRFLELYPGNTPEQVLQSSLRAQTDSVMTRAMHRWAHLHSQSGTAPAFLYFFSHTPPERGLEKYGAYHGAEVAYAYDNLGVDSDARYTGADYGLRDQMSEYWISFIRAGDPAMLSVNAWPDVEQAPDEVMEFTAAGGAMADRPRAPAVDFWLAYEGSLP
jgi:para-nitrobenzyl esterase